MVSAPWQLAHADGGGAPDPAVWQLAHGTPVSVPAP
jgi:hypothetical protein